MFPAHLLKLLQAGILRSAARANLPQAVYLLVGSDALPW